MTDQADETIIVRYVIEAQDAITKHQELRAAMLQVKTQIKDLATQTGASYKQMSEAMVKAFSSSEMKKAFDIAMSNPLLKGQAFAEARTNIANYKQAVNNAMKEISKEVQNAGTIWNTSSKNVVQQQQAEANAVKQAQQQEQQAKRAATQAWLKDNQQQANAMKYLGEESKKSADNFSTLKIAVGAALGTFAVQMIRQFFQAFINYGKEAIQTAYEFTKGLYQINVGVNALRRAGTDITFGDVLKQLQKLKSEFGIFATKDLVVGASAFLNLNRDMGFTKEQLFDLQEAVATLAVVNGRAMDEVQKTVALALSSGYTEGLQRLGVSINRVTIAEEAGRLGFAKSYMALTEQQRALATYNLILRKTAVYQNDLLEYQKTIPGAIDTANAALIDQSAIIGESLLPVYKDLLELWVKIVKAFSTDVQFGTGIVGYQRNAVAEREKILGRELSVWEKIITDWKAGADYAANVINATFYGIPMPIQPGVEAPPITQKEIPILNEDQITAIDEANKKILDLQRQYDIDRRDMATDLQRDLAQIEADGQDKLVDLAASHAQKMLDISNKASDDITNLGNKYALDVQQAWDDYYSNVASAAEQHSNKLLKIEEDYQEKLKRLKEGFLLDLEDALQARDARQVLRLIRQYNLEKTQAKREQEQNLREEERNYREQVNELNRQRDDRLKKLQQEFALRNAELIKQRDRELALEIEAYTKKKLEQEHENEVNRGERLQRYQEDLDDLALHLKDRTNSIAQGLIDDGIATAEGLQGLLDITNSYIGANGGITQIWANFIAYIQAAMTAAMTISSFQPPNTRFGFPEVPEFAEGGMEVATKRTTAVFGEKEPELAFFIPLSKIAGLSTPTRTPLPDMKSGTNNRGKAQIEILLEAGLEGKIIDRALGDVADIVVRRIQR